MKASETSASDAKGASDAKNELRGSVLDVLGKLLSSGRTEDVIALVAKLVARNNELELLLAKARQSKNASERIAAGQLDLFLKKLTEQTPPGELADANAKLKETAETNGGRPEKVKPPKQPPVRRPPPPGLRRVDNPILVPESERPCPICGAKRKCVRYETTEMIDLIPAEVIVRLDRREVLACGVCDGEMVRAPMGDKVVCGGAYGSRLVAHLIVDKYKRGMPLHRQGEELEGLGLSMPSSSMADQITWGTDLLRPIHGALLAAALEAHVLHLDGTGLPVRDKDSAKGLRLGSLWGYVGDTTIGVYLYTSTGKKLGQRPGEVGPEELLAKRAGFVVADASNLFDATFNFGACVEVGCNMHARRYFKKALDANDARAAAPIAAFKALYDVEASVVGASVERILEERQRRSKPVYDELIAWCEAYQPNEPPSSLLGKAIQYLLNHQIALTRFLDNGTLPIDNGIVERLHRTPAITRRAFLFAGSHAGGERAAIAYSIIVSCDLVGVNPEEYLADILPLLAREGVVVAEAAALLPAAWKKAREQQAQSRGSPAPSNAGNAGAASAAAASPDLTG